MELPWAQHDRPVARIGRGDSYELHLASPGSARRVALEQFIRQRFELQHGARIRHFMPCLFGLENQSGQLLGAVGVRSGNSGPLFLERYLDEPIEHVIAARSGEVVERADVVEVGNLAARGAGMSRLLIVALTRLLATEGVRWVGFTGTPALINSFRRLGIALHRLAPADPARLGVDRDEWGSYYDAGPQVMVAEVPGADRTLATAGTYRQFGASMEAAHGLCG